MKDRKLSPRCPIFGGGIRYYDVKTLVRFPHEEQGKSAYRVVSRVVLFLVDLDVTVVKMYSLKNLDESSPCPVGFPHGYGRPPSWVEDLLENRPNRNGSMEQPGLEGLDDGRTVILLTQIHGHPNPKWKWTAAML